MNASTALLQAVRVAEEGTDTVGRGVERVRAVRVVSVEFDMLPDCDCHDSFEYILGKF